MSIPVVEHPAYALPFAAAEFQQRLARLRERMTYHRVEAALLTEPADIYYLSGYDTQGYWNHQALFVPVEGPLTLVCFVEEVGHAQLRGLVTESYEFGQDHVERIQAVVRRHGLSGSRVGVDLRSRYLSVATYLALQRALPDTELVDVSGAVEHQRLVKSPSEISYLRDALEISNTVIERALNRLSRGVLDRAIAMLISAEAIARGSDYFTQSPYVRFGPSLVEGHLTWQGRRLEAGHAAELEVAAVVRRYNAPTVRFAVAGPIEGERYQAARISLDGLERARSATGPGQVGSKVWAAAREAAANSALTYLPGGYSVGIGYPPDWTESDLVTADSAYVLEPGMVFHMVSFCQLPDARIGTGDVLLVTTDGCESLLPFEFGPFEIA